MKKSELSAKLKAIKTKISEIENADEPVYKTANKFLPNIGHISEIETLKDCVKALSKINKQFDVDSTSASVLGINVETLSSNKYFGFSQKDWQSDIQTRVAVLKNEELLNKLKNAEEVLKKHRSEEDVFNEDMESISDVLEIA